MILEITVNNDDVNGKVSDNISIEEGEGDSAVVTLININYPSPTLHITTTGNQLYFLIPNTSTINFITITVFSININTTFRELY